MTLDASALIEGRVLDIGGVALDVRAPDRPRAEAAEHLLAGMRPLEESPALRLRWQDAPVAQPARPPDLAVVGLELWHEADAVIVRHGPLSALASDGRLLVGGDAGDSEHPWLDFRRVFEPAITHLLVPFDRYMLHGAAVARGDAALYITGDTGRGKSTLAWAAYEAGWSLLADDYVIARPCDGGYEITGLRKPVAVPGELFDTPPAGARPLERAGRRRWEFPASILTPGWFRLAAVVFPAHGDATTAEVRQLNGHDSVVDLLGAFIASGDPRTLRAWFPHAAALSRLPLWELRHVRSKRTRLAEAARALDLLLPATSPSR